MIKPVVLALLFVYLLGFVVVSAISFNVQYDGATDTGVLVVRSMQEGARWPIDVIRNNF